MMKRDLEILLTFKGYILLLAIIMAASAVYGQDKKELEERKTRTQKEIEETNTLLQETQKSRKNTLQRVRILNKRIQLRNEIINNINKEIKLIENDIEQKELLIEGLESDLVKIKCQLIISTRLIEG